MMVMGMSLYIWAFSSCENSYKYDNGSVDLIGVYIQRNNLLTTLRISVDETKIEMKFLSEEEYRETYQQLDEKHQAYVKEINEKSLL